MRRHEATVEVFRQHAAAGDHAAARDSLVLLPPADAARALTQLEVDDAAHIFRLLDTEPATELLAEMPDEFRQELLERLEPPEIADVVEQMAPDEATDVLQDLEPDEAREVLAEVEPEARAELEALGSYDEETAGGIMTNEFATVPVAATAGEALDVLRRDFADVEQLNVIYAVDTQGRLVGSLSLRDLVLAEPGIAVRDLVERHRHWVEEHQDQEQVAHYMRLHDLDAVPVVDENNRIVGQVTLDDAASVIDEEAAEDMLGIAGLTGDETVFGPLGGSLARRLPWLLINAPLALAAANVINIFEHTIAAAAVLAVFLPVIGGMAGNAAGQTLTVFIRGLAVGELTLRDTWRATGRQLLVGMLIGLILGLILAGVCYVWKLSLPLAAIVGVALLLNCITGALLGSLLPLLLRRLGMDPAMGSNTVTTSITDAFGYLYLLGLGTWALNQGWLGGAN